MATDPVRDERARPPALLESRGGWRARRASTLLRTASGSPRSEGAIRVHARSMASNLPSAERKYPEVLVLRPPIPEPDPGEPEVVDAPTRDTEHCGAMGTSRRPRRGQGVAAGFDDITSQGRRRNQGRETASRSCDRAGPIPDRHVKVTPRLSIAATMDGQPVVGGGAPRHRRYHPFCEATTDALGGSDRPSVESRSTTGSPRRVVGGGRPQPNGAKEQHR